MAPTVTVPAMSAETVEEVVAPEPEVVPAEPPARHRDEGAETPIEHGTPAGQVALGALSVLAVGGAGLYSATGVAGLVVGGAATVAAGGGYAYHRFRRAHPHKGGGRSSSASRHGGASRTSPVRNPLSGLTSRSGRRAAFFAGGSTGAGGRKSAGSGRSGLRMPSLGGAGRAGGKAGGKRMSFPDGKSAGGGRSSKGGRVAKGGLMGKGGGKSGGKGRTRANSHRGGITGAAHKAGGAGRKFGRLAGKSARGARTVASRSRHAGSWINRKTGGRAGRAFGYPGRAGLRMGKAAGRDVAKHARRAGGWVDRRTSRRISTAWNAMRGAEGFRAARRRGVAALGGWDAQVTASLLALVALLAARWKRANARKAAQATSEAESTATAEAPGVEAPESVVHGGDPPITAAVTCPRCSATHTVTIPGGHSERIVTCGCGYRIRFFRIPDGPFTETAETKHAIRPIGRTTQRGSGMSGMITHATELPTIASSYETEDMMQVKGDLEMLRELPLQVAAAIRLMTERLSADYPIHQDVVEGLHVVYEGFAQLANACDEVSNTFQAAHEADIARRLEPRTNEQKWNHQ